MSMAADNHPNWNSVTQQSTSPHIAQCIGGSLLFTSGLPVRSHNKHRLQKYKFGIFLGKRHVIPRFLQFCGAIHILPHVYSLQVNI